MVDSIENDPLKFGLSDEAKKYFLKACKNEDSADIPEKVKNALEKNLDDFISLDELLWLQPRLPDNVHFYKLMEKCEIIPPKPKVEPRNPELEARIKKLKLLEEERRYREMTKNVDSVRARHPEDTIAYQVKEMNRQLIGVLQILISIGTGFAFGFIGMEWLIGPLDSGFRLLLGIFFASIIGIAEIYFFIKKLAEPLLSPDGKEFAEKND